HAEIQAEFVEPLVEQPRHHRGRPIEGVPGREGPPRLLRAAHLTPLFQRQTQITHDLLVARAKRFRQAPPADAFEVLADNRPEFEPVAVGVDYGMAKARADRRRVSRVNGRHRKSSVTGPPDAERVDGPECWKLRVWFRRFARPLSSLGSTQCQEVKRLGKELEERVGSCQDRSSSAGPLPMK